MRFRGDLGDEIWEMRFYFEIRNLRGRFPPSGLVFKSFASRKGVGLALPNQDEDIVRQRNRIR